MTGIKQPQWWGKHLTTSVYWEAKIRVGVFGSSEENSDTVTELFDTTYTDRMNNKW